MFPVAHGRFDGSGLKTVSNHREPTVPPWHCKDDNSSSLDGMASLSFQSFWGIPSLHMPCYRDLESCLRANGKRQFVPRDPLFPLTFSYIYTQIRTVSCQVYTWHLFVQFLAAYFLIWEIVNLNLTFAVCRKLTVKLPLRGAYTRRGLYTEGSLCYKIG